MEANWQLRLDAPARDSPWALLTSRLGGPIRVLLLFGVFHLVLAAVGLQYREPADGLIIIWPAAGLLFLTLWLAERRYWLWILLLQIGTELLVRMLQPGMSDFDRFGAPVVHAVGGLISAVAIRRMLGGLQGLRVVAVLMFMVAGAIGAAVAALLWAGAALALFDMTGAAHRALLNWLADLLGALVVVPPMLAWLIARHFRPVLALTSTAQRVEVAVLLLFQVVIAVYVFSASGPEGPGQLRFPVLVAPGMFYVGFRLPPRWATTLISATVLVVLWMVVHGGNPLGIGTTQTRFIWIQVGATTFMVGAIALNTFVTQSRIALAGLAASQARYRSFIEMSNEVVWRIELALPMPVDLPLAQQLRWLREHASVAESSASFAQLAAATGNRAGGWAEDLPWVRLFESDLAQIQRQGYRAQDLRFVLEVEGRSRTFLTSFNGVVHEGRLERIWGLARDTTELLDLNARLMREQELLRSYAQRIVSGEDNTRHRTAADLHNGIGQELIAMGMRLAVLSNQLAPEQRPQLDELRGHLHTVQQRVREMISDLSPPGLHDLGLLPALQWLVVYLRSRHQLKVALDGQVEEAALPTELRVPVFKMVQELLRNVVKHAGVDAATVTLHSNQQYLVVTVADAGRGFLWNPDMLVNPPRGFGLWSIANRIAELGGRLDVSSAPGDGARLTLEIQLRR